MSVAPPRQEGEAPQLVIVQRGRYATFERLARVFANDPGVLVTWDRRSRDRRQASTAIAVDRRRSDRRSPSSWSTDGYLFVHRGIAQQPHP